MPLLANLRIKVLCLSVPEKVVISDQFYALHQYELCLQTGTLPGGLCSVYSQHAI